MAKHPMTRVDHAWLRMDIPQNLIMVNSVLWTDQPIDPDEFRSLLLEHMVGEFPKFTWRPEAAGLPFGRAFWVDDEEFDIDRHILSVTLDEPADAAALQAYVGEQQHVPLDPAHPLWQIHFIPKYGDGSAVLYRFHHAIADGMALSKLFLSMTTASPDASFAPPVDDTSGPGLVGRAGKLISESVGTVTSPSRMRDLGATALRDSARLALVADRPLKPVSVLNQPIGITKLASWSSPIPLADFKRIGRTHGCTVNDVVLAALGGALHHYLASRGEEPADVPVLVPVDLRPPDAPLPRELGNAFGFYFVDVPAGSPDPVQRLRQAHEHLVQIKDSPEAIVTLGVLAGMGSVPTILEDFAVAFFTTKVSGLVTNVPGPREPVYLCGAKVEGVIAWVPRGWDLSFGVAIFSYNDAVTVGVSTDAATIPDPEVWVSGFENEIKTLLSHSDPPSPR